MKHIFYLLSSLAILCNYCTASAQVKYDVIPLPQNIRTGEGAPFVLTKQTKIVYSDNQPDLRQVAEHLSEYLSMHLGVSLEVTNLVGGENNITIEKGLITESPDAYILQIQSNGIKITGADASGAFYGDRKSTRLNSSH